MALLLGADIRHALSAAVDGVGVADARPARPAHFRRRCCRACRRSTTIASCSRTRAWGATRSTACSSPAVTPCCPLLLNVMAGYAFAKLRFAGRDRIFRVLLGALVIPGAGGDDAAVPAAEGAGAGQQLRRRDRAGAGQHLRHLPRPPVRAARSPTSCSKRRASTAPASSDLRVDRRCRCSKPIIVTLAVFTLARQLERLHVAADRADRQRISTRCRSRSPLCRASTCRTTS